ncbi:MULTISPECIES: metallophosphoesterase [unclassified Rhodococcus (in: high G+C Gram-positive bacteria)]|uniref:metallophosphoesterase family protein n=1 Tax=unclassified Rhodococcus (in: high G+C Gram-positive bacteria) TaxID=192944 RepID=UPI00163B18A8|nr:MULTISPECIES: metallophosphoesterase [unclassified Rhodococcus (in: high G+C Gram-positive bacteria)]MBC2639802.1 metallophosphoesterase [Rhodococcus sp. 3A]MBC2895453.1 metallophosphoesterase [Rhodococcus sp. 4CII]
MKIVQISDTHLSARGGRTQENFDRIVEYVNDHVRPDLIVHSGDIVIIHPDDADDRAHARELMRRFDAPVLVVPGNHDVGEPGAAPWKGIGVSEERVAEFEAVWGPDHWRRDVDGWTVLGLNSELFGSGLDREAAQWRWIERSVADVSGRPVIVFLHKPIWSALDEPVGHAVDIGESRTRLLALLDQVSLAAVGSGHLHCYRQTLRGEAVEVWAPATGFVGDVDDTVPGTLPQLGIVEYHCEDERVRAYYRSVPGLDDVTATSVPEVTEAIAALDAGAVS